jgi:hypothetical protein
VRLADVVPFLGGIVQLGATLAAAIAAAFLATVI